MQIQPRRQIIEVTRAFRLTHPTRRDVSLRWANGLYVRVSAKAGRGVRITFEGDEGSFSMDVENCPKWLRRSLFRTAMRASRNDTVVDHRPPEQLGAGTRPQPHVVTAAGRGQRR